MRIREKLLLVLLALAGAVMFLFGFNQPSSAQTFKRYVRYISGVPTVCPIGTVTQNVLTGDLYSYKVGTGCILAGGGGSAFTGGAITTPITGPDGTAGAPTYSFSSSGNSDNGMFLSAANALGFSTAGTERWTMSASGGWNCTVDGGCDIGNGAADPRDFSLKRNLLLRGATSGSVQINASATGGNAVIGGNTFTTGTYTLTGAASKTFTFNNSLTLAGTDATTITFPSTSQTIPGLSQANTWTVNGALSAPGALYNGTWVTGGSATTTKPYFLVETTGATSAAWSTAGTGLGINAASGFTGNLIEAQLNGASKFLVTNSGAITIAGSAIFGSSVTVGSANVVAWLSSTKILAPADGSFQFRANANTGFRALDLGATASSATGSAPANGQTFSVRQDTELLTIAAAATSVTTMQVPAGAVVLSVSVRVTTVIPTATTFTVSIGSITFNTAAVNTAANTTDVGTNAINTVSVHPYIPTTAGVTITPNLTPADNTGRVRVTVTYYLITPPTS